jgi:hypothetical protein
VAYTYTESPDAARKSAPRSTLAQADYYRQRDTYILAKNYGDPQCARLWRDFETESPADARLVIADVNNAAARKAEANQSLDAVLVKAEKRKPKTKAGRKARKAKAAKSNCDNITVNKSASPDNIRTGNPVSEYRDLLTRDMRAISYYSTDPVEREWMRAAWAQREGAGAGAP